MNQKLEDPEPSWQIQKLSLQLKYLLTLSEKHKEKQVHTINCLNHIYPFTKWPLPLPQDAQENNNFSKSRQQTNAETMLPPIQLFECPKAEVVSSTINQDLKSYAYIIVKGRMFIKKGVHQLAETQMVHQEIKERLFFNIQEGNCELWANAGTVYLKIHKIWIDIVRKRAEELSQKYVRDKLMKIPFFAKLSFSQFDKYCKKAVIQTIGPGDFLLEQGVVPYYMYVITEGELIFSKIINFCKQNEVWSQLNHQLQHIDDTSDKMLQYLIRQPINLDKQKCFEVKFQIGNATQGKIICGKQTLDQQKMTYSIQSNLKTKVIRVKYPDLYVLKQQRLQEIRTWAQLQPNSKQLRKQYYYGLKWQKYKDFLKREGQLNRNRKLSFKEYLRNNSVDLNKQRYQFQRQKVGQGDLIDSPAGMLYRFKTMTLTTKQKQF